MSKIKYYEIWDMDTGNYLESVDRDQCLHDVIQEYDGYHLGIRGIYDDGTWAPPEFHNPPSLKS